MNSKSLRRLAGDHGSLHTAGLPPNYLFPSSDTSDSSSDLTSLDVLLAGPVGTPYSKGVWRLRLDIPPTYPTAPPTATFRTRMWHPNVDESTGAVCVETLKRDWVSTLKLRDVLVTISCLLIQPNPASALNEAAGQLASEDWAGYCRRARLMTDIHAAIPESMASEVRDAQMKGEDKDLVDESKFVESEGRSEKKAKEKHPMGIPLDVASKAHQTLLIEDEENRRKRGETAEVESDPESDWIPGPTKTPKALPINRDNIFGITGLETSVQMETPPNKLTSKLSKKALDDQSSKDLHPRITVSLKHHTQHSLSKEGEPTSVNTTTSAFSDPNHLSTIQSRDETSLLHKQFSLSWVDSEILYDTGVIKDGPTKVEVRKRMASEDFEQQETWEQKMFKRAGFDLARYNRGDFGPKTGLHRL